MLGAVRMAARTAGALLSVIVLAVSGYAWNLSRHVDDGMATSEAVTPAPDGPTASDAAFTVLLVGLDSRTDASGRPLPPEVLDQLHAGPDEGQLHTDTIILLHVPAGPDPHAVAISFPRDSFVEIAGDRGRHKINSAYRRGMAESEKALVGRALLPAERDRRAREAGRRALVDTLHDLTGVRVDHFAEVNLAGFVEISDALGGVPVCLNRPAREERSGIDLPAGPQVVQGPTALAFVRQRHGLDGGDLDRISRQQAFLAGLADAVLTSGLLHDPVRLNRVTQALGRYVVLDRGWNTQELLGQLHRVAAGDLRFETIPTGTAALDTPVDGVAVQVDPDEVRRFVQQRIPVTPSASHPGTTRTLPRPTPAAGSSPASATPADTGDNTDGTDTTDRRARPAGSTPTATSTERTAAPPITTGGVPCVD
ncbi:LCP family protein [Pseudonocardia sp.]|uniref:LCP family protein n=1 Tax=Pseudonocardia sp. TaxID=60912 RepID=UPI003D1308E9